MLILVLVLAYLLGAIPFGVVVCRPLGKDPRLVGSGRTGGTNVYRTAGLLPALLTIAGDIGKGWLAVVLAERLLGPETLVLGLSLAALAAILGHIHSLFLGFRGGAGATPNVGAVLAIDPLVGAFALAVGLVGLLGLRVAALGTLLASAAIALGLTARVLAASGPYAQPALLVYAFGQLALIVWTLRPNLVRLRAGTERRVELGRPKAPAGAGASPRPGPEARDTAATAPGPGAGPTRPAEPGP